MRYVYGMRLRGFSPGAQPMNGLICREDDTEGLRGGGRKYHDILKYDRELRPDEVRDYELDYMGVEIE